MKRITLIAAIAILLFGCSGRENTIERDDQESEVKEPPINFEKYRNASYIDWRYQNLKDLSGIENYNFEKLTKLDLTGNNLSHIHLKNMPNLQYLELSENNFRSVDDIVLEGMDNLKTIDINNSILNFDTPIKSIDTKNLKFLSISAIDEFETLPARAFENLPSIEILTISEAGLKELQTDTFAGLYNLKDLYLNGNKLKSLSLDASDLNSLSTLSLLGNQISNISELNLDRFKNLKTLELSDNQISELKPYDFKDLSLETLSMTNNPMATILPDAFSGSNLKNLFIGFNTIDLDNLPFSELYNLENLFIKFAELTHLPEGVFDNQRNLRELSLTYNYIEKISGTVFKNLANLEHLDLQYNRLTEIDKSAFDNLHKLQALDLSENMLSDMPDLKDTAVTWNPDNYWITRFYNNKFSLKVLKDRFNDELLKDEEKVKQQVSEPEMD